MWKNSQADDATVKRRLTVCILPTDKGPNGSKKSPKRRKNAQSGHAALHPSTAWKHQQESQHQTELQPNGNKAKEEYQHEKDGSNKAGDKWQLVSHSQCDQIGLTGLFGICLRVLVFGPSWVIFGSRVLYVWPKSGQLVVKCNSVTYLGLFLPKLGDVFWPHWSQWSKYTLATKPFEDVGHMDNEV